MPDLIYYNDLNDSLTTAQRQQNAYYIAYVMINQYGFTLNSVAGMLGNWEGESHINPNVVEGAWSSGGPDSRYPGLGRYGYGLAQWTPWYGLVGSTATERRNYHGTNSPTFGQWCLDKGYSISPAGKPQAATMEVQLEYMAQGLGGWSNNSGYFAMTWAQFKVSTESASKLAEVYYRNYERSAAANPGNRPTLAQKWYDYLLPFFGGGPGPGPGPGPEPPTPSKYNFLYGGKRKWPILFRRQI